MFLFFRDYLFTRGFICLLFIIIGVESNGVPTGYYVQVDAEMRNVTKEVGDSLKLHCEITGNPVPEYHWLKDQRAMTVTGGNRLNGPGGGRRVLVESIPWGSRLSIESLNADDTGWYTCLATNHHDNQTTSAYLNVVPAGNLTGSAGKKSGGKRRKNRPFQEEEFEDGAFDYDDDGDDDDDDKVEYEIVYVENGDVDRYDNMAATKNQKKNQNRSRGKSRQDSGGRHSGASCSVYTGKVCRAAFNNQSARLAVATGSGSHAAVDKKLAALHDAMMATSQDDLCTRIAMTFLCRVSYRVCDGGGSGLGAYLPPIGYYEHEDLAPLCKEDCRILESDRCSSKREILRLSSLVGDYQNLLIRDSMCSASLTVDQPTPPCIWGPHASSGRDERESGRGFPHVAYVAAILGALALVTCLLLIFYGRRRRQQKNKTKKQKQELESNKRKALLSAKDHQQQQQQHQPSSIPSSSLSAVPVAAGANFSTAMPAVRTVSGVNVTFLYPVGNGHFGPVYAAQLIDQNPPLLRQQQQQQQQQQHVIAATLSEHADLTSKSRFECEMRALSSLGPDHPNVLRCVAVCPVGSPRSILFEMVDGTDLKQGLLHLSTAGGGLDPMTALEYCCQVARGFEYLAERNYYHGDLSARNVLVPRPPDRCLRITNLGVSRQIYESDYCIGPCGQIIPLRWCPAERVVMAEASPATEIWSFGVLLWEILTCGQRPYSGLSDAQLLEEMSLGKQPMLQLPGTSPEEICRVVEECWHPDPSKRVAAGVLRRNMEGAGYRLYNNNVCLSNFNTLGNRMVNDALLQHSYPYNPQGQQMLVRGQQAPCAKTQFASPATSSNQTSSTSAINSPSRLNHAMSLGTDDGSDANLKQYTC